ncbi:hypothetical protein GDO78_010162 [Eleutherodactylus coqui]|uniref:Uncharacterized protein n=1 Tax=Eleutherodactylus coqui TaxID=57060 RepID=A0A8J6F541_ELECQ|nr:hypothetical protein GDO78_010162 [Eleutherodactylus coqui]
MCLHKAKAAILYGNPAAEDILIGQPLVAAILYGIPDELLTLFVSSFLDCFPIVYLIFIPKTLKSFNMPLKITMVTPSKVFAPQKKG